MAKTPLSPSYTIKRSRRARTGLKKLPPAKREEVNRITSEYLAVKPLERIPGITKGLHGLYKGFYQYDVDKSNRIIYSVNKDEKTVYIDMIGSHPDW
ncbi:MAG: hypothetical protein IH822_03065 [Chloroflexi bacterium]|nr:hypothetical protein [Chloroflexota bacterium]